MDICGTSKWRVGLCFDVSDFTSCVIVSILYKAEEH